MKFIRPKRRKYKTDWGWLKAIYKKNQKIIDDAIEGGTKGKKYKIFKNLIKDVQESDYYKNKYKNGKVTVVRAFKELINKETFTPKSERLTKNFLSSFKKDKELYESFRKEVGIFASMKPEKFRWDDDEQAYIYDVVKNGKITDSFEVYVETTTSPVKWVYKKR